MTGLLWDDIMPDLGVGSHKIVVVVDVGLMFVSMLVRLLVFLFFLCLFLLSDAWGAGIHFGYTQNHHVNIVRLEQYMDTCAHTYVRVFSAVWALDYIHAYLRMHTRIP